MHPLSPKSEMLTPSAAQLPPTAPAHPLETDFDELVHKPHAASRNVPVVSIT